MQNVIAAFWDYRLLLPSLSGQLRTFLAVFQVEKSLLCNFMMLRNHRKAIMLAQWFSTFSESWLILCFSKVCMAHCSVDHSCVVFHLEKKGLNFRVSVVYPVIALISKKIKIKKYVKRSSPLGEQFCPDLLQRKKVFTSGRAIFAQISKLKVKNKKSLHLWNSDFCLDLQKKG